MAAHDSLDRSWRGARLQRSDDDELTLVGVERARDLSGEPVAYVEPPHAAVAEDGDPVD
jgi:hypothetical protein